MLSGEPRRVRRFTRRVGGEILGNPFILIGSVDGLVEELRQRRERLGIDYCGVFEKDMEAFAPIVE